MHAPPGLEPALVGRLYDQSGAGRWQLSRERFEAALSASLANARASTNSSVEAERYLPALHLEDLALACACADGNERAWEHFIAEYRASLNRAAIAIDPAGGSDLADSIHGDLFGLQVKDGERQSLFRYFHGRSRLGTWLRAILSQRHIDRLRVARRHEPLPDDEGSESGAVLMARDSDPAGPERARFLEAVRESLAVAIAGLATRDRLRLSSYYAEDMTLAAIGRMLGEHEATVSRHLARTRREIRTAAETRLRERYGFNDDALAECFRSATEDAGALDLAQIFDAGQSRKIASSDRSKR